MRPILQKLSIRSPRGLLCLALLVIVPTIISVPLVIWLLGRQV